MIIGIASFVTILIAVGSLARGYVEFGFDPVARWLLYFGALWLFAQVRRWWWFSAVGLVLVILLAGIGLWIGVPAGWMFSAGIFSLIAWDLSEFRRRYRFVESAEMRDVARRHLARLSFLAAMGLFLSSLVMMARGQFTSQWTMLLISVGVLGLTQLLAWVPPK